MTDEDFGLGGSVDLGLLAQVADQAVSSLPSMDSAEPSSILRPLSTFLADCVQKFGEVADCAFLFSSDPERDFALLANRRAHAHLTRPRTKTYSPSGRLHMVAAGAHRASSAPASTSDAALESWLEANGLSNRPIALYQSVDTVLIWYPEGIAKSGLAIEIPVNSGLVSLTTVDQSLRIFYEKRCRVPDKAIPFWHHSGKRVPRRFAEKDIQKSLLQTLETFFHKCRVEREVPLKDSEVDFAIFGPHAGRQAALCVIEVKVLRQKRYKPDPVKAADCPQSVNRQNLVDGVEQVAFARDELSVAGSGFAPLALMAAFDMRAKDDETIMQTVAGMAASLNVEWRRYFMFNSKKAYRKAEAQASS